MSYAHLKLLLFSIYANCIVHLFFSMLPIFLLLIDAQTLHIYAHMNTHPYNIHIAFKRFSRFDLEIYVFLAQKKKFMCSIFFFSVLPI